jgi:hypothetical protein
MIFDREREGGHEGCQRSQRFRDSLKPEKKRDTEFPEDSESRYRYADCSLKHCFADSARISQVGRELVYPDEEVWDSRVRVQNFLTEDTGRGHSLGSEIEGWFATVERPSSVGPPVSVCGTEDRRVILGARMGK